MRSIRRAKAIQQKTAKFKSSVGPEPEKPTWESVITDADERMAELRRTMEWAKQCARRRLGLADHSAT